MPVHLYGQPGGHGPGLRKVAGAIPVIEDACQAHGARYQGRRAGSLGDARLLQLLLLQEPRRATARAAR